MTGRAVDQLLPHPGDPRLSEPYVRDATTYLRLAEEVNGPVPRPVPPAWPWGDALPVLAHLAPDARIVNLETSVTRADDADRGKAVHYRMTPENVPCLTTAGLHVCTLANNHSGDFGQAGLRDTLHSLAGARLATAGAGEDLPAARRPAAVPVDGARVLVFSVATTSSGVPPHWAAAPGRPGVDLLPDLSHRTADALAARVAGAAHRGDLAIVSIHWGSNWGYEVPPEHVRFAHRLVDGGVDLVYGHSSHHPRPIEVYRGKLVLYGCGDLVDDYEGIGGHEAFRADLRLLYFATLEAGTGRLVDLRMAPLQARRLRLRHASRADTAHLRGLLDRISGPYDAAVGTDQEGFLRLR